MSMRLRKLIGLVALLLWIFVYAILAMGVAVHVLPHANGLTAFAYYAIAGLAWIIPILPLIRWMQRPDPERNPH